MEIICAKITSRIGIELLNINGLLLILRCWWAIRLRAGNECDDCGDWLIVAFWFANAVDVGAELVVYGFDLCLY